MRKQAGLVLAGGGFVARLQPVQGLEAERTLPDPRPRFAALGPVIGKECEAQ